MTSQMLNRYSSYHIYTIFFSVSRIIFNYIYIYLIRESALDIAASQSSTVSSAPSVGRRVEEPPASRVPFHRQDSHRKDSHRDDKSESKPQSEDTEDTMKNLRKTFAGIFGDM